MIQESSQDCQTNVSPSSTTKSAILYQNPTKTITLFDIPFSISLAQGTNEHPSNAQIYSSPALPTPFLSTEPKSEKAKANVLRMKGGTDAGFPEELLFEALKEIKSERKGTWCLQRDIRPSQNMSQDGKRKFDDEPELIMHQASNEATRIQEPFSICALPTAQFQITIKSLMNRLVYNPHSSSVSLVVEVPDATFNVPPKAGFFITTIALTAIPSFRKAASTFYPIPSLTAGPGQFDFILLDPPWNNRSVRRSANYETLLPGQSEALEALCDIMGSHIAPGGLVACWITNKKSVKAVALNLLEAWDVELIEEWAWLKTTVEGAPVTEITGLWRKPYEILLLGRKRKVFEDGRKNTSQGAQVVKRIIVAVPDLHSRKPHLKELIEPLMQDWMNYRALEIFARNLTAGWWAWGDEALKFNWQGWWSKPGTGRGQVSMEMPGTV